jgi:hypothetical protein
MQELSPAQDKCLAIVASYMRQSFGELAESLEESPGFRIRLGGVMLYVEVTPMGDDDAAVQIYGWVGRNITPTAEMNSRLLEMNNEYRFGRLALDGDNDVVFEHAIPADAVTKASLALLVRVLASTADDIDDELRMRFG